jgi:GNAT superfamily N-acetyltransferase
LRLATDPARWRAGSFDPPGNVALRRADEVDETRLRRLDDALRQDVPGTDGWRWDAQGFHKETFESPHFDPAAYLVAVDHRGDYVGIARLWMKRPQPRLGFVGVRHAWRRQGIGRALVAAVLRVAHQRGLAEARTEVDETNVASGSLLMSFSGETVAATLELVRDQPACGTTS